MNSKLNKIIASIFFIFPATLFAQKVDTVAIIEYIKLYKNISIEEMNRTGVPASITLAQGIHESGFGKSYLAKNTNNHFGIKCKAEWKGKTFKYTDDAPNECFRVYDNVEESYKDHSDFLKNRAHYAPLFSLDKYDYKGWAFGLKKAGYATNPKYPQILIKLIDDFQLYTFDKNQNPTYLSSAATLTSAPQKEVKTIETIEVNETETKSIDETNNKQESSINNASTPIPTALVKKKSFKINKANAIKIYPSKGETLDLIANLYNLDKEDILQFNDMTAEMPISEGQTIFIQRKKKSNKTDNTYTIKKEDNMWSIAQKKGVQLNQLLRRNKLITGEEPAVKAIIFLKGKIKEKPAIRTEKVEEKKPKTTPEKDNIVRANDTIYPEITTTTKLAVDSNTVLRWENETKLLEKPQVFEIATETKPTTSATTSTKATQAIDTTPTVYPTKIDYNNLPKSNNGYHTVVKGDTMYNICKRYTISIPQLMEWNQLSEQNVKLGQVLKIQN